MRILECENTVTHRTNAGKTLLKRKKIKKTGGQKDTPINPQHRPARCHRWHMQVSPQPETRLKVRPSCRHNIINGLPWASASKPRYTRVSRFNKPDGDDALCRRTIAFPSLQSAAAYQSCFWTNNSPIVLSPLL